jgi:predicted methyltransferase
MRGAFIGLAICAALAACDRPHRAAAPARAMSAADYDQWRRPDALIATLALRPGDTVADIGAGTGYLTGRLAAAVGPRGRVVATDVDPAPLARIAGRPRTAGEASIETRVVRRDDAGLEPGLYHLVLMAQVDHLVPDRVAYLSRLRAALAPAGRLAVSNRLSHRAGLLRDAGAAGYRVASESTELPGQFVAILVPGAAAAR